jgi:predicted RNase H-like HicB family nuclease
VLFKTIDACRKLLDYHKRDDGSWLAEFHGALDVAAEGPTLEQCRSRALDVFDEKLAAWIAGTADSATPTPPDLRRD